MLHLYLKLKKEAQKELIRRDISGSVTGIRFIYNNCLPMIRIAFSSEIQPKPVLTRIEYIEQDNYDNTTWYLYTPTDVYIQIK